MKIKIFYLLILILVLLFFLNSINISNNPTVENSSSFANSNLQNSGSTNTVAIYANFNALRLYHSSKIPDINNGNSFRPILDIFNPIYENNIEEIAPNVVLAKDYYNPTSSLYDKIPNDMAIFKSNIPLDFTMHGVKYVNYTIDNRYHPNQTWIEYFNLEILKENGENNTPTIITESWSFNWNGVETVIVNASNIVDPIVAGFDYLDNSNVPPNKPLGNNHLIYSKSAIFIDGQSPIMFFTRQTEPVNGNNFIFDPMEKDSEYLPYYAYSSYQFNEENIIISPIYIYSGGNFFANYLFEPLFFFVKTDNHNGSNLFFYNTGPSKPLSSSLSTYTYHDNAFKLITSLSPY